MRITILDRSLSSESQQQRSARYEGPKNTDYRPGNTHDRLTADPQGPQLVGTAMVLA